MRDGKKVALVLSGGGARGAFQFGAEQVMREVYGYEWDVIAGVSVGALNGSMIAQHDYDALENVWKTVRQRDVYTGHWFRSVLAMPFGRQSLYDNGPLLNLIRARVDPQRVRVPFDVGVVSMKTGRYMNMSANHPLFTTTNRAANRERWARTILASTIIPIIWKPIDIVPFDPLFSKCADGGLRNVCPLADVLSHDPDEIVIINCQPGKVLGERSTSTKNILTILKRTISIMSSENFVRDVDQFVQINRAVADASRGGVTLYHASGRPYKEFTYRIIEPNEKRFSEYGDGTNFSRRLLDMYLHDGRMEARKVMSKQDNVARELHPMHIYTKAI